VHNSEDQRSESVIDFLCVAHDAADYRAIPRHEAGRMAHPAQVLAEYASKAFNKARNFAAESTNLCYGLETREMPTSHEIRALSSQIS
jgi:hypothetical protein